MSSLYSRASVAGIGWRNKKAALAREALGKGFGDSKVGRHQLDRVGRQPFGQAYLLVVPAVEGDQNAADVVTRVLNVVPASLGHVANVAGLKLYRLSVALGHKNGHA